MATSVHYELLSDFNYGERDSQTGRQVAGLWEAPYVLRDTVGDRGCGIMCVSTGDLQLSLRCRRSSVISPQILFDTCWHHPRVWPHTHTHFSQPDRKCTHLPKHPTRAANGSVVGDRFLNKPFKSWEAVSYEPWNAPETLLWEFAQLLSAWRWYQVTN